MNNRFVSLIRLCLLVILLMGMTFRPQSAVYAIANLSITPITWNIIGLDSNNVNVGPNDFPIGARVCNTSTAGETLTGVSSSFVLAGTNPYISPRPGTSTSYSGYTLTAGSCVDFYYEVEVTRTAAAYDTAEQYYITADSNETAAVSTPTPRELYVEHLVSQSRNAVTDVQYGTSLGSLTSVAAGGTMTLLVGNTYYIRLIGFTATQGYEQLESFINIPNTIFQVNSVSTTYTADTSGNVSSPNDKAYGDACKWENNPNSPNYRACLDVGKVGGNITVTYQVTILQVPSAPLVNPQPLSTLIYDFSGSSFHYNSDFGVSSRYAFILDPSTLTISKNFAPDPTNAGGISTLTFTLTNPNAVSVSGLNFTDTLPTTPGAMTVANPTNASTSGCGTPTFAPVAGAGSISFSNGTIAANSTCTIKVNVTVPVTGTYTNTSNHLFIGSLDTGHFATDPLTVNSAPVTPSPVCGLSIAQWTFPSGFSTTSPAPSSGSGTATPGAGILSTSFTEGANSWGSNGSIDTTGTLTTTNNDYVQFAITTTGYSSISLTFDAARKNTPNSPQGIAVYYSSGTANNPEPNAALYSSATALPTGTTAFSSFGAFTFTPTATTMYVRIYFFNAGNTASGSDIFVDNVTFTGCAIPNPPTITKSFSPNPIAVNGTSTLTFTLSNSNSIALIGVTFSDSLPAGLQVAATPTATTTCGGIPTWAPAAGATNLTFGSPIGATIPANGSCTVSVNITGTASGSYQNISGFISSTNGGTNTGSTGSATATLTVLKPPVISKLFAPNPILSGGTSTLTFTISNPNLNDALTGVAFSDTYPLGVTNTNPASTTNTCGGVLTAGAGLNSVSLSGGTITGGGSCTITTTVTVTGTGTYANTSGAVSSTNGGTGNTASDTLTVNAPHPAIAMLKQVATSASGPWTNFVGVVVGSNVYYRFTVENAGDVALTAVNVSDPAAYLNLANCAWKDGDGDTLTAPFTLPVADSTDNDHIAVCTLGPVIAVSGSHPNTSTATGTYAGTQYTDQSTATYATTALTLDKTVTETSFLLAGDTLHYSYLVTNSGFAALLGPVTVTDNKATVTCPAVNTVGDLDDYLDPGESVTCTATYIVTAADATAGFVTNVASATAASVTSNTDTVTVNQVRPELTVAKTNNVSGSLPLGGSFTWTLTVSNSGLGSAVFAAGQRILSDPLPGAATYSGLTAGSFVNITNSGNIVCNITAGTLNCSAVGAPVTIGTGGSFVVTFTVTPTSDGILSNTATVDPDLQITETLENNNTGTNTVTVTPVADLAITKTDGVASVNAGGTTTYTIRVTNNGPSSVTGAILSDPAVVGLSKTGVTCSATPGQCVTPPTVAALESGTFALPVLASGQFYEITVTAAVTATTGNVTNTATVTVPAGTTDPTPGNNTASDTDTVNPVADLAITKTDGVTSVNAGGTTTYTIRVTNNGPSTVTGAVLSDPAVAGLSKTAVACSAIPGQCATPPTIAQLEGGAFALPALASGQFYEITVTANVTATSGSVTNTATAATPAGTTDPTPGNNTASDTDTITPVADLAITKSDGVTNVNASGTTTYTIRVTNNGPSSVTGAILSDPAVAGLNKTNVTCSAAPGQCVTAPTIAQLEGGAFALPALASGEFYEIAVTADVTATSGNVTNTAIVTAPAGTTDPTPGNNTASDTDTIDLVADLSITKTDGSAVYTPGGTVTYTVTVTNSGPSDVTGVTIDDPRPVQITTWDWACTNQTGGATGCTPAPGSASDFSDTVDLPAGGSIVYTVTANINPAATGNLVNTATVTVPGGVTDPAPGNNTSTDTDTINSIADLSITKTDGVTNVNAGGTTTYTIRVINNGPSNVTGAILSDPAAAGLNKTAVACSAAPGQCVTPPTIAQLEGGTFVLPALASGQFYEITVTASVTATSGTVTNTATAAAPAGATDPTPGNNTATDTDTVNAIADLAITKSDGVATVSAGGSTTYTVRVTNNGPSSVTGAILSDPAAAGLSKTNVVCSATPGQCVTAPTIAELEGGAFALPALASGEFYEITVTADVTATSGSVTNTANASPSTGVTDPTPGNNTAIDTDTVTPVADLAITKSDGVTNVNAGGTTTYTIRVTNNGPSNVSLAVLSDPAVPGLNKTAVACSATPGQCVTAPTVAELESGTFLLPDLANGEFYEITVTAAVTATSGSVTNVATVTAPAGTTDPTPGNNLDRDTDTIDQVADLSITKTDGSFSYVPGVGVTYTVTVTNNGPSDVTGATVTDAKPAQITTWAWACTTQNGGASGCTPAASSSSDFNDTVDIPSGGSIVYTVTANTDPAATGNLINTATVTVPAGTTDPTPGNNSATDLDEADPQSDLAITKTDGVATVSAGGTTTYTIRVTNNGPSSVIGAIVDPAVAGLTKTAVACSATPGQCVTPPTIAQLETGIVLPLLAPGEFYEITVTATVTAISGSVTNTATVAIPVGWTDPTPGNNTADDTDLIDEIADLSISKTDGVTNVNAGGTTTYTIRVTNNGPSSVTGAILSDPAVAGLSKTTIACSATPGQCVTPPTVAELEGGAFALPVLASGEFYEITVSADVTATSGNVTNTASITAPAGTTDPTPGNNTASDTDTIDLIADLSIAKTDGSATYTPGGTVTYTVTVTNNGPSDVTGATIDDARPTQITTWDWACTTQNGGAAGCTSAPSSASDFSDTVDLPAGGSIVYTVTANIDPAAAGSLVNTATVTIPPGVTDPTPGNNTSTDTDTINSVADLTITKTDGITSVNAGGTTTYTIRVTNNGPSTVTGAILSDPAVAGLSKTAVACSATPGQCVTAPTVAELEGGTFALPALASGDFYEITVTADVTAASGSVTNTATVAVPAGTTDPTPGNNSASDTDTIDPQADLSVTKTDGVASVPAGGSTTYTIRVTNNGPSSVTGAILSDPAVAGLTKTAVACSATPGQCVTAPTIVQLEGGAFALPALASGEFYEIAVTADVTATTGTVTNTATVALPAGTADPTPGNNTANDTDAVGAALIIDPALAKSVNPTQASVGDTVTFTLTVTNAGNTPAPNVVITDPLPAMFDVTAVNVSGAPIGTSVNVTPPIGTGPAPYTVVVTLGGNLGVTSVVTINIVTTVNSLGNPPINNSASLTTSAIDADPTNNTDSVTITLRSDSSRPDSNRPALLPATGFAPDVETRLPAQPQDMMYTTTDVVLEIPSLGVKIPIVGVPKKSGAWDVAWLGRQAGWLEGSAFPSWNGNSILTSHVYASNGLPGPFVNLSKLKYGDQVIVHAYGQKYIFAIQSNQVVSPDDTSAFRHEEKPWLTLITCKEYDQKANAYKSRVIVRAILVKVLWDR